MVQTADSSHAGSTLRAAAKFRNKVGERHAIFEDDAYLSEPEDVGVNLKANAL